MEEIMDLQEAIKLRILKLCKQRKITINKLATLSGMPQSTVNSLVDGTSQNPKMLTIVRICLGLDMELKEFFDDDVFKDLDDE
jgi:transcriptional regulator with XRE-family HTH domain